MHRNQIKKARKENPKLLRDKNNYKTDVDLNSLSETGILDVCVFNELRFFFMLRKIIR